MMAGREGHISSLFGSQLLFPVYTHTFFPVWLLDQKSVAKTKMLWNKPDNKWEDKVSPTAPLFPSAMSPYADYIYSHGFSTNI